MNHLCWVNHAVELGFAYETEFECDFLKRKVDVCRWRKTYGPWIEVNKSALLKQEEKPTR